MQPSPTKKAVSWSWCLQKPMPRIMVTSDDFKSIKATYDALGFRVASPATILTRNAEIFG